MDGQQRLNAIIEFFDDEFSLPDEQKQREIADEYDIAGKIYSDLHEDVQAFLADQMVDIHLLTGIQDPSDETHQRLATEVFWRLQQGEHLTNIEKNHSKIYSPVREFIVKYADDISFDKETYEPLDANPNRHKFFGILTRDNNRLQHLSLLAKFMLIEIDEGSTRVTGKPVTKLFDAEKGGFTTEEDLTAFKERNFVQQTITMLDVLYDIFSESTLKNEQGEVELLNQEYLILSYYTLLRQLVFGNYNLSSRKYDEFLNFAEDWYRRFEADDTSDDSTMMEFKSRSQSNRQAVNHRHYLIEREFWKTEPEITETDERRVFSRGDRIELFFEYDRVCSYCAKELLEEARDETIDVDQIDLDELAEGDEVDLDDARVSWAEWDADHIEPYSEGGETSLENGRVLCEEHNRGR